jgi:hypothetical protein
MGLQYVHSSYRISIVMHSQIIIHTGKMQQVAIYNKIGFTASRGMNYRIGLFKYMFVYNTMFV